MKSAAATVDEYLEALTDDRRSEMARIHALVRDVAPALQDAMRFGMPAFLYPDGRVFCAFNAQKKHLALYVGEIPEDYRLRLTQSCDIGKGCVRFSRMDEPTDQLFRALLADKLARNASL